ncbi:MAG: PAS domain-containing methyl-accepting chemotaxis protein [Rhodospirillum sp.]|nr:PAS domain-containing methyl-accepting chemotaxis protein [Rhodospirillum sp.]MCF8490680.1 PAS domain-containing methyl-accepting chemotaxis protein [Rhodospirillum sp.]
MSWIASNGGHENAEIVSAIRRSQGVIEFDPSGKVLAANQNFLDILGYRLEDVVGKHHSMFVDPEEVRSQAYKDFWVALNRGESQIAQFKRLGKGGKEVWIEASYNPLRDRGGKVSKVIKFAIDVTNQRQSEADLKGQVDAIGKSQAMIAFDLDGTIRDANQAFLDALGYRLEEIVGRKHAMFMSAAEGNSQDYKVFWDRLRKGEFQKGRFPRKAKGGQDVWIEGAYNPILDANGRPSKVVKYAQDVTPQMKLLGDLRVLIEENFGEIGQAVNYTESRTQAAAAAVAQTASTVQMVASASEELAASIREISESMARSRETADNAFDQAERTGNSTQRLLAASEAMNGIVGLIQDIAGQINLLALNATIEAARAGDAGKGFAVVANEVKNLANQAAKATDQITREIQGIQQVSDEVDQSLGQIRLSIDAVREYVGATAAAVDEQSAVTQSMSRNMQEGATSVESIGDNINGIVSAMSQVVAAVDKTRKAAEVLSQ